VGNKLPPATLKLNCPSSKKPLDVHQRNRRNRPQVDIPISKVLKQIISWIFIAAEAKSHVP